LDETNGEKSRFSWLPKDVSEWDMPLYETMDEVSSEAVLTTENEKAPLAAALTRLCLQTRAMLSMLRVPKDELDDIREEEEKRLSKESLPSSLMFCKGEASW